MEVAIMNGFFNLLMFLFFLSILVSFAGIIYAFIKKKRKKPFVKALFASILLLLASSYAYHQTESPEQLAADRQRRLDSKAEQAKKKAEREQRAAKQAKDDADQKQAFIDKQVKDKQDAEDAKLQKKYDDQAKYEAWLAQKAEQEKDKEDAQNKTAEDDRIKVNGTYTVSMDMLITREYHDVAMVQRAAENQDNDAIISLTYEGKIFTVNEGTSVTVLDKGYGYAAVCINNGEYIDQTGYIPIATLE